MNRKQMNSPILFAPSIASRGRKQKNTKQMNSFGLSDPLRALYSLSRPKTNEQEKTNELFHSRHLSFQDPKKDSSLSF